MLTTYTCCFYRLVLHLFFHDVHTSAGLQKPPLMTLTELKFNLPASHELWMAKTAVEWSDLYYTRVPQPHQSFTIMNALEDPDSLHKMADYVDVHLCAMTLLHGYWNQIWTLAESKKFYPASRATHRLSIITSHRELSNDLANLADKMPSMTRNSPVATLLSEFFMMILHVSPEELQRFAGKYGEEEARHAYVYFKAQTQTLESRTAIWHAGQVLMAAKTMTPTLLRGFNAIAVYYSSLTLWAYGLVTSSSSLNSTTALEQERAPAAFNQATTRSPTEVALNEPMTTQASQFKASGRGVPGITTTDSEGETIFIPLKATDKILRVAQQIYKSNFPVADEPLPPLVVNLANLLKDLSSLPGSKMSRAVSETPQ
jgi:hypothetical protein